MYTLPLHPPELLQNPHFDFRLGMPTNKINRQITGHSSRLDYQQANLTIVNVLRARNYSRTVLHIVPKYQQSHHSAM